MYISTRGNFEEVSASTAIRLGMVPHGGLFVPGHIPVFTGEQLESLRGKNYNEVAKQIISSYLDDYDEGEITACLKKAYNEQNFSHPSIAPIYHLHENIFMLELWHGPTAAFKDMALQLMPHLLSRALEKSKEEEELVILVATSGDTGKAALEGFKNVPGVRIIVFYPAGGVSRVQELQMTTTDGTNTYVVAVHGNFDDCQSGVKDAFVNSELKATLGGKGFALSSANSINWGRLLPQIVYYFWAWLQLAGEHGKGIGQAKEGLNIVVPTGNFGNILAAWYAWQMGLPVKKLICASNENRVLTDFFQSGIYDSNREFQRTSSPSMDILISGNLERLLFAASGGDGAAIQNQMDELKRSGVFRVDETMRGRLERIIYAGWAGETETRSTIRKTFDSTGYLLDTHTAVALHVYENYRAASGDTAPAVIASTASPFKFSPSVLEALQGDLNQTSMDEFETLTALSRLSGVPVHPGLQDLQQKPVRHKKACNKEEIASTIASLLVP